MLTKKLGVLLAIILLCLAFVSPAQAISGKIMGVHILSPVDLDYAIQLLKQDQESNEWHFLTIPLTLDDMNRLEYWQDFFKKLKQYKFIPIVRLATRVNHGIWEQPNRKQIVGMFNFMNQLDWPQDERLVIVFNEVNHAKEWGNQIDPISYAQILEFAANWAHTEEANYKILPAAMDLAAPNGPDTMEAFTYLDQMYHYNPWIFSHVDFWNSHSYPNPGFSSSPTQTGKNSIRGFEHELAYLRRRTGNDYRVIITETGWVDNRHTRPWLTQYYLYAMQHVWTHPQVIGVTPFLLRGAPGPFSTFSFFDEANQPTVIYNAFREAVKGVNSK
jgi:hypothetical protein